MNLIKELKENNQDFEWYPTTKEVIEKIYADIQKLDTSYYGKSYSLLDIGTGNGKVFNYLQELYEKDENKNKNKFSEKYAIEKSEILVNQLDKNIFIIGTDFEEQTLIDKKVDIIFCNPPYKKYLEWTEKIIRESNCKCIYLVIPDRWEKRKSVKDVIKLRNYEYTILDSFDFLNAEDRQARAKVDLIKIWCEYYERNRDEAFNIWFDEHFEIKADKNKSYDFAKEKTAKEKLHQIIKKENLINELENFYKKDMETLLNNYKAVESLDSDLLRELEVNINSLKESLKMKIKNLKNLYWKELFDNLSKLTDRLTMKSREKLLNKLMENTNVDFTAKNAYSIIIWAIKNSNIYFDEQLCKIYKQLSHPDNVVNYKSNKNFISDRWRYAQGEATHYKLDYRIIYDYHYGIQDGKLNYNCKNEIRDIFTIAYNLGFFVIDKIDSIYWERAKQETFYFKDCKGKENIFCSIRIYKNCNIHFKFNQKFMKKLNIETARINKWIKNEKEASEEMNIPLKEVMELYNTNFVLDKKVNNLLLG